MSIQEKIALLEDMLGVEEGTLTEDMMLDDIDEWNSLAYLSLVVLVSDEFDKKLLSSDVKKFKFVKEILDIMEK